ncbi:uncharacterized protein NECHADRAFT_75547 [Fusarium vanettenii 77-13-4]|uniref:Uncharacterized protein n=1 Tax=Fusarium vanettenii (strain ATCC MYA-4622 / CBS 123669 / FGSC 9596 / NRRL 45880 / 77-13-4) TaxID=660122 RepID=C7YJ42_FUSV7|nr:uncharacterized protein NECHADRAFT_75547 [Fusarium vanettenii 77-13-4]EEU48203.1 predicted protein [Fusarium vanettenii 77-13-4]
MFRLNTIFALFAVALFSAINLAEASSHAIVLPPLGADPCTWGPPSPTHIKALTPIKVPSIMDGPSQLGHTFTLLPRIQDSHLAVKGDKTSRSVQVASVFEDCNQTMKPRRHSLDCNREAMPSRQYASSVVGSSHLRPPSVLQINVTGSNNGQLSWTKIITLLRYMRLTPLTSLDRHCDPCLC